MLLLKQSTSFRRWFFIVGYNSTSVLALGSNVSLAPDGLTGLTIDVQIAKDGASSFSNPAGGSTNLTEVANGWYYADFASGDADTLGPLEYQLTWNSGANSLGDRDQVCLDVPGATVQLLDVANGTESGVTVRQALRLALAALAGKLSGAATTTVSIRDTNDSKDRIVATVDASGNRSAVTLDAT